MFTVLFLSLFLMASVTHAVASGTMTIEFALAGDDYMTMSDCDGCNDSGDGNVATCGMLCFTSVTSLIQPSELLPCGAGRCWISPGVASFAGTVGPPETTPPRTLF